VHVAVIGAGALGAVYGVRLALRGDARVTFVVRPKRAESREPLVIERIKGDVREVLEAPSRSAAVPADADVVMVAVGTEDLDALALGELDRPFVVLTPMMPKDYARMRAAFGERVLAALPSVVSYARKDGVVRYWLPPTRTRIDEPPASPRHRAAAVRGLAEALTAAGLPTRLELGVHDTNPATTACFIPLAMALSVAGTMAALANDEALCDLAGRACREGVAIGRRLGRPEPGAILAPALGHPWALRAAIRAMQRLSPEALFYAEEHFARKLSQQNLVMAREMAELARERGLSHEALDALASRLAR
jgi:ketopantoate reductase